MKNSKIVVTFVILISFFISCKKSENKGDKTSENTTFYTCSMDPQIKEDHPGNCPICHMELTPMKKDETAPNEIALSAQQIQLGNVKTMFVDESSNVINQQFTGTLTINQEKINTIASRASGRIERLFFKTTGGYISKNSPVYEIYSEDLAVIKQDYLSAVLQQDLPGDFGKNAKNIAANAKQKLKFYGLSDRQINQIISKKDQSPNTIFYSTYDGYVSEIMITEGSYVMDGTSILKLAALNNLWFETQVDINYSHQIRMGQKTQIEFANAPEKSNTGIVSFINPEVSSNSRFILVRIEVPNPKLDLKPGMQGMIKIQQSKLKGMYLPIDAVIQDENASYVWLEKEKGVYKNVMVTTGLETNGLIEIKSGLEMGNKVVVSGTYLVNSEYIFRKGNDPMAGMKM